MRNLFSVNLLIPTLLITLILCGSDALASNLSVSNVAIASRNPSTKTLTATFDIAWENSWKTKINHDAVWITLRLHKAGASPVAKRLCPLTASGLNPLGTDTGTSPDIEIYVPADKSGAFLRLSDFGIQPMVEAQGLQFELDYEACGFDADDSVYLNVFALEMVYIPQGEYHAGDFGISTAVLTQGSADADPWNVTSAGQISVSNPTVDGFRYSAAGHAGEDAGGSAFSIPAAFPKGFAPFYVMKYEVTEGQWVEFLNSLPSAAARAHHDLTDSAHKNSDAVRARNTVTCSGSPLTCSTQRPYRAAGYLSWMNLAAFLDWAALRPMTELEFEKAARGPIVPEEGEFAWGNAEITAADAVTAGDEAGSEQVITFQANAHFGGGVISGGDAVYGAEYTYGPLRSGIFAGADSSRITAGASYYGVMELSGNVWERTVTIGNASGRNFTGSHGDGLLSTVAGYEGYANQSDWPGINPTPSRGVDGADGSGFRGGSYGSAQGTLRISDRSRAAESNTAAAPDSGGRGARTYDAN